MADASTSAGSPFSRLDPLLRQIRLLRVDPDPSDLSAVLETVSLDDGPTYTALSYTWGTEYPIGAGITLRGPEHTSRVPVTKNLQAVLQHLCTAASGGGGGGMSDEHQQQQPTLTLWVDALCINQADTAEKSHQITLMKDVYSRAEETCVWLGPAAGDSDLAMETIGRLYAAGTYVLPDDDDDDALSEAHVRAINALMRREWWSRIWVVQEAMLSPKPVVRCGSASFPIEAFVHLDDIRRGWVRPEERYLANAEGRTRFLIQANIFQHILTDYPETKLTAGTGVTPLAEYARLCDRFNATDPRDKIYGLLGLAMPSDVQFLAPDYSQSVASIYTRATARFIIQYQELLWLQFDNDNKNPKHDLPSWCPDYSSEPGWPQRGYTTITAVRGDPYSASGSSCWGVNKLPMNGIFPTSSWGELHLPGLDLDAVEYVGPNPFMEPYTGHVLAERMENIRARNSQTRDNVLLWEKVVKDKWQRDGFPYDAMDRYDAFWMALMWDRDWEMRKVTSGHRQYFDAWLARADVDASYAMENSSSAGMDDVEVRRTFVKPFTDCCISRCHGRSFVITRKGYVGVTPFKTRVGDKITVLQGGTVPFVLRARTGVVPENGSVVTAGNVGSAKVRCEFVGEAFVLGIMEGQAVAEARQEDVKTFVLT
ncbi:ankyrin and HET domain-containing protein [Diaporthe helianthi]|uniref:Ankyrin and HET domain-containing protein n=1 Tax=Diaporthe helianthi TaxID=158607 RepID=A0A2P5IAK1_DIAHE|nr:ankyrin and HET domain-containing protein [Diaporthe helianthi]